MVKSEATSPIEARSSPQSSPRLRPCWGLLIGANDKKRSFIFVQFSHDLHFFLHPNVVARGYALGIVGLTVEPYCGGTQDSILCNR